MKWLILLLTTFLYAAPSWMIAPSYKVKNSVITLKDLYPQTPKNVVITTLKGNFYQTRIPLDTIMSACQIAGINATAQTPTPWVIIEREDPRIETIASMVIQSYAKHFENATISSVDLSPISPTYEPTLDIVNVIIPPDVLRNETGTVEVHYGKGGIASKKGYFRFSAIAFITAYKAKHNITNDKIVTFDDVDIEQVRLGASRGELLTKEKFGKVVTSHYVRAGSILFSKDIKEKPTIIRNAALIAYFKEGEIEVSFPVTAVDEGVLGSMIRVKNREGKMFSAKVIASTKVLIQ